MGKPALAGFLAALVLCSPASLPAQPPGTPSPESEAAFELPPREFAAVDTFVDAVAVEEEAALMIDSFWQPAIAALVAANPGKAELARSFGVDQRSAELAMYRPLVAMMLDNDAVQLLNPDVRRRLEALQQRQSTEYARTRTISAKRHLGFAQEYMRIRSGPAKRVNTELEALAALARTPDGFALRELYRRGYFWCVGEAGRISTSRDEHPECTELEKSASLARLKDSPLGKKLIVVTRFAYGNLAAMVQMAHAPGISLHGLLPPEEVEAAGLAVPTDLTFEELVNGHTPNTGRPS